MVMKASHTFNLLDARGAISVTERAAYIGRVRTLRAERLAGVFRFAAAAGFPDVRAGTGRGPRPAIRRCSTKSPRWLSNTRPMRRDSTPILAVPQELLILTMRQNQKYFPAVRSRGKPDQPVPHRQQHEAREPEEHRRRQPARHQLHAAPGRRALFPSRPTDQRSTCLARAAARRGSSTTTSSGTQLERTERVRALAKAAQKNRLIRHSLYRAAGQNRSRHPVPSGEFPRAAGGDGPLLCAGRTPRRPARPTPSNSTTGCCSPAMRCRKLHRRRGRALADKLETLAGLVGIGSKPTGDKDPFCAAPPRARRAPAILDPRAKSPRSTLGSSPGERGGFGHSPATSWVMRMRISILHSSAAAQLPARGRLQRRRSTGRALACSGGYRLSPIAPAARSAGPFAELPEGPEPGRGEQAGGEYPQAGGSQGRSPLQTPRRACCRKLPSAASSMRSRQTSPHRPMRCSRQGDGCGSSESVRGAQGAGGCVL